MRNTKQPQTPTPATYSRLDYLHPLALIDLIQNQAERLRLVMKASGPKEACQRLTEVYQTLKAFGDEWEEAGIDE
jgi:hypothetical protein